MRWRYGFIDSQHEPKLIEKGYLGSEALDRFERAKTEGVGGQRYDRTCIWDDATEKGRGIVARHNISETSIYEMVRSRIIP